MKTDAKIARELLEGARKRVAGHYAFPICGAIACVLQDMKNPLARPVAVALSYWIADMLKGRLFYTGWVYANHYELYNAAVKRGDFDACVRRGRLAWIDWMLEQDLAAVVRKYK